ncbi:MAG: hypothetical protein DWQ29_16465 [Planctomycetota bacterium]|nr:MAG: hypothetical protein DWQ29_16465 [Planctomycetota bacterium]
MSAPPPQPAPRRHSRGTTGKRRRRLINTSPDTEPASLNWLDRLKRDARTGVGGLFVSGLFHTALLIIGALILIASVEDPVILPLDVGWLTAADQTTEEEQPLYAPVELPNTPREVEPTTPTPTPDQEPEDPPPIVRRVTPVDVSDALRNRGLGRNPLPENSEHNEDAQRAIEKALGWLSRRQQQDGRWSLHEGYPNPGTIKTDTGATALALLAFLGTGQTHQGGEHQQVIAKGLDWLRNNQRPSGDLFDLVEQGKEAHFYAHSQGTIAICEALALTGDPDLTEPAQRAVDFLTAAQNPVKGGWKYRPLNETGVGDLSVTGWALMALHTARMAGIEVSPETYLLASSFLDSVQESPVEDAFYKYRPDWAAEESQRWSMTAEGLLCRQWLGWEREDPSLQRGVRFLLSERNTPEWKHGRRNLYAWYYTAQTLHNMGGDDWTAWYLSVQSEIVSQQASDGSWHPTRPAGVPLEYASSAGRLYITVLSVLILETPYRHAPIYEKDAG